MSPEDLATVRAEIAAFGSTLPGYYNTWSEAVKAAPALVENTIRDLVRAEIAAALARLPGYAQPQRCVRCGKTLQEAVNAGGAKPLPCTNGPIHWFGRQASEGDPDEAERTVQRVLAAEARQAGGGSEEPGASTASAAWADDCGTMRALAETIGQRRVDYPKLFTFGAHALLGDAADALRVGADALEQERAEHEKTKAELASLRAHVDKLALILDEADPCNEDCELAGILAWVDPADRQRVAELRDRRNERLRAAEDALREVLAGNAYPATVARTYLNKYVKKEGP